MHVHLPLARTYEESMMSLSFLSGALAAPEVMR
ncbi:hypothetical protein SAMN05421748_13322 [Paractinoplanes atraurantiacus]|uniref:Uncharacterized protein n=1 Tax=Paractinoplanes atraurantiacus TaxID=1036182 RepID=A0A285K8W2_9ACTN|nr:hypothetical protein SAMN05421748_13322 [Actinoplanes atraurantiacus]